MGTYRVTAKIGVGALFESYLGASDGGDQPVYLRRMVAPWSQTPGFVERLAVLAQYWRVLPREAVSELGEFGPGGDSLWVTQAIADGETLRAGLTALAARQQRLAVNEAVAIGVAAASALAAIHERSLNLHHGDVCATTLVLASTGHVQLTDFGIATALGAHPQQGCARSESAVFAPEQQAGKTVAASDVYRLGLVLLELLTGRLASGPPWVGMPDKLSTILAWMLARNPADRPSPRDVEQGLEHAASTAGWPIDSLTVQRVVTQLWPNRSPRRVPATGGTELQLRPTPGSVVAAAMNTPAGVAFARISTRKVTPEALAVEKDRVAAQAPRGGPIHPSRDTRVAEMLVAKQLLTATALQQAVAQAESLGASVNDTLLALSLCDEDAVIAVEAELTKTPVISSKRLLESKPTPEVLQRLRVQDAEALGAVPLAIRPGDQLVVAVRDPLKPNAIDSIQRATKAASVLAVRAGPAALARAVGAFYQDVDVEDPSSWLENTTGVSSGTKAETFGEAVTGLALDDADDGAMELEARGTLGSGAKASATLDDPQATLVEATLALLGEKGRQVQQLISLAGGVTRRLGASDSDVGRVRFCAAAIGVVNVASGKAPWEPLSAEHIAKVAGSGWRSVHELASRGLEVNKGPASDLAMLALQTTLIFTSAAGSPRPKAQTRANALQALKSRQFPQAVIDAVAREVS